MDVLYAFNTKGLYPFVKKLSYSYRQLPGFVVLMCNLK